VKAPGLASLLTSAEQSMKDQKFADAAGKYLQASRVAPNNPMITLGQGIAHLGGANYGQSEQALRLAIRSEPALLMGRYDLNSMIGEARVTALRKDLKTLADAGPDELRPRLLLAFLSYNSGNGPDAEKYLAEAAKLVPDDAVIQSMQKAWAMPGADAPKSDPAPAKDAAPAPAPAELNK
jgi:cytochrome c-type biogenesis protein CcmH/NrfG